MTFYNDNEPYVQKWLSNLITGGQISEGVVDGRPIQQLTASDLREADRVHLFAGIGGWDYALRLAGWPANRAVWTASVPCQPFSIASVAGHAHGMSDNRHLWPDTLRLVKEYRPSVIFGEQVPKAIGADHFRERVYWCADASSEGWPGHQPLSGISEPATPSQSQSGNPLIDAKLPLAGDYSGLLPCDGLSVVMERAALKGYGNAIVPQVAALFIRAFLEAEQQQ